MTKKRRASKRRVIPIDNLAVGRLHRIEDDWVLVIFEYEGRDIRAIFRRDEVDVIGSGPDELLMIKDLVKRKKEVPTEAGVRKAERWRAVVPTDAVWVKNRHQTPVVMSRTMQKK